MSKKFVIIVPDGAADYPIPAFGGKTIFEAAKIPNLNSIAMTGIQGLAHTVPSHLQPGSDVAMMAVLGYDSSKYYTGRAPIEAVAQEIELASTDWVFRTNLVTIKNKTMADHSAGHITSEEGKILIDELNKAFGNNDIRFYAGVGYRHLMVIKNNECDDITTQPPHDNIGKNISDILPRGMNSEMLNRLITNSQQLLQNHPINQKRKEQGKNTADSIWFWGQGKKARMDLFEKKFGIKGAAITAVDLVKGLAFLIGFDFIKVQGATGSFDTNYAGKGKAAIEALKTYDIVLVHIEATDEAGHVGNAEIKKKALEEIDKHIIGPVFTELKNYNEWRILVMPDHPTPVSTRGHVNEPVPFAMAGNDVSGSVRLPISEANAEKTGIVFKKGYELMEYFLRKK